MSYTASEIPLLLDQAVHCIGFRAVLALLSDALERESRVAKEVAGKQGWNRLQNAALNIRYTADTIPEGCGKRSG